MTGITDSLRCSNSNRCSKVVSVGRNDGNWPPVLNTFRSATRKEDEAWLEKEVDPGSGYYPICQWICAQYVMRVIHCSMGTGVKRPGRESDHPPLVPTLRTSGAMPPLLPYAFMSWTGTAMCCRLSLLLRVVLNCPEQRWGILLTRHSTNVARIRINVFFRVF